MKDFTEFDKFFEDFSIEKACKKCGNRSFVVKIITPFVVDFEFHSADENFEYYQIECRKCKSIFKLIT